MQGPLITDAADEVQLAEAEQERKRVREIELRDLRTLLALPEGRRVFLRHLRMCGIYKCSYIPGRAVEDTVFAEGMRNVGLRILADLNEADPHALEAIMKQEHGSKP